MRTWPFWIAGTLVLAAMIHLFAVLAYPSMIMSLVHRGIAEAAGGTNVMLHAPRADAASRGVVRPSPDLLYAVCAYDLTRGPVRISSPVPDTYWSLSLYADNTDNFYTVNDRQIGRDEAEIILLTDFQTTPAPNGMPMAVSPSPRGLALIRVLVSSEEDLEDLQETLSEAACGSAS